MSHAPQTPADSDAPTEKASLLAPRKGEGMRLYDHRAFRTWGLAVVLVSFGIISLESLRGNLWIDEIITLQDFIIDRNKSLSTVFRSYKDPNNHILFTAAEWLWIRMMGDTSEELMRFPSLITGGLSILIMYAMGRRLLDRASGFFLALIMAFSPIFLAFACQLRGYSMSIMFAAMATFGAMHIARRETKAGLLLFVPAALLIPAVIPSNLMVTTSLWVFMAISLHRAGSLSRMSGPLAVCAIAVPAGMWVYLPIMDDLIAALSATDSQNWSSWDVIGNWVTALLIHAGAFTCAAIGLGQAWRREHRDDADSPADGDDTRKLLPLLALCCAVPMILVALAKTPYPRSLLGFLPPLTICVFYFFRQRYVERNIYFYLTCFFVLCNALAGLRLGAYTTQQRLANGEFPQSLVQQFYARNRHVSDTVTMLRAMDGIPGNATIFTDYRTYFPLKIYWQFSAGDVDDSDQIECIEPGIAQIPLQSSPIEYVNSRRPQLILAYSHELARQFYAESVADPAGVEFELTDLTAQATIDDPTSELAMRPLRIFQVTIIPPDWAQDRGPGFPPRPSPDTTPRTPPTESL